MRPESQNKDSRLAGVLDRGTLVGIMRILSLVREESGLAKKIRSLSSAIYRVSSRLEGIESVCRVYACKRAYFGYQNKNYLIRQILFVGIVG